MGLELLRKQSTGHERQGAVKNDSQLSGWLVLTQSPEEQVWEGGGGDELILKYEFEGSEGHSSAGGQESVEVSGSRALKTDLE